MLKTALARASIVVFIITFFISYLYIYNGSRISAPREWYGYSQGEDAEIDIRSPNGRAIAAITLIPMNSWSGITHAEYQKRCGSFELAARGVNISQINYRGVLYCNSSNLNDKKFDDSFAYFKILIDNMYGEFYGKHIENIFYAIGIAFAGLFGLLGGSRLVRWIFAGS